MGIAILVIKKQLKEFQSKNCKTLVNLETIKSNKSALLWQHYTNWLLTLSLIDHNGYTAQCDSG